MTDLIDLESDDDAYFGFDDNIGKNDNDYAENSNDQKHTANQTIMLLTQHIQWLEERIKELTDPRKLTGSKQKRNKNKNKNKNRYSKRYNQLVKQKSSFPIDTSSVDVRLIEFIDYCLDESCYLDPTNKGNILASKLPQLFDEIADGRDAFSRDQFRKRYHSFPGDLGYVFDQIVGTNKRVSWKKFSVFMLPFIA